MQGALLLSIPEGLIAHADGADINALSNMKLISFERVIHMMCKPELTHGYRTVFR